MNMAPDGRGKLGPQPYLDGHRTAKRGQREMQKAQTQVQFTANGHATLSGSHQLTGPDAPWCIQPE